MTASLPSTKTQATSKPEGYAIPTGLGAEGLIVRTWCENVGTYGAYGVITRVEYVQKDNPDLTAQCFTGYQYTIVRCNEDGTINGGLVQMCGNGYITTEGYKFYDTEIPFDDDIPF